MRLTDICCSPKTHCKRYVVQFSRTSPPTLLTPDPGFLAIFTKCDKQQDMRYSTFLLTGVRNQDNYQENFLEFSIKPEAVKYEQVPCILPTKGIFNRILLLSL